jgi:murein DD-endopeptidase MepM/ murein hydrolase activator NlpD
MAKDLFVYDSESCTYVKQQRGPVGWLRANAFFLTLGGLLAGGLIWLGLWLLPSAPAADLRTQNRLLRQAQQQLQQDLHAHANILNDLRQKKRDLHKLITNSEEQVDDVPDAIANTRVIRTEKLRVDALQDLVASLQKQANRTLVQQQVLVELVRRERASVYHLPTGKPLREIDIICGFGNKKTSYTPGRRLHEGIDLNAAVGTPVQATGNGTVTFASHKAGGGTVVLIDHGGGYVSGYRHLDKTSVYVGSYVRRGQVIGTSGNTGLVRGPHLHYEVLRNGRPVDPLPYLTVSSSPEQAVLWREKARKTDQSME